MPDQVTERAELNLTDAELEAAAREHCREKGEDPDKKLTGYYGDPGHRFLNSNTPENWRFTANCLDHYLPCLAAVPRLAAAPAMLTLLEALEWSKVDVEKRILASGSASGLLHAACPCCFGRRSDGHATDCRLAAVLKAARGEA